MALWGNKCDLSISAGQENAQTSCPLDQVNKLQKYVLIDDLESVWQHIRYVDHKPHCLMMDSSIQIDIQDDSLHIFKGHWLELTGIFLGLILGPNIGPFPIQK